MSDSDSSGESGSSRIDVEFGLGALQEGRCSSRSGRAIAGQEDRRIGREPEHVLDQVEEGRLGPFEVIEPNDQGALVRERLEQFPDRPEGLLGRRCGFTLADGGGNAFGHKFALLVEERRNGAGVLACDLFHDLDERPVRDALAVGQATAQDEPCIVFRRDEFPHEPRLADARWPKNRYEPAGALSDAALKLVPQRLQRPFAAHEGRVQPARESRSIAKHFQKAVGGNALGLPLQLKRFDRLDPNGVADE